MAAIVENRRTATTTRQQTGASAKPRPALSPTVPVLPHPRKASGAARVLPVHAERMNSVPTSPLPMGQKGTRAARVAKNLSVRSPMVAAVICASFGVSLLCCYVSAYARVNAERLELSRLRQELKTAQRREITLNGEISRFHLSATVRAQAMGLMPAPPDAVQVLQTVAPAPMPPPVR